MDRITEQLMEGLERGNPNEGDILTEMQLSKFRGKKMQDVLRNHGFERYGETRGVQGHPGEVWLRGGSEVAALGGGKMRVGHEKVVVIHYPEHNDGRGVHTWQYSHQGDVARGAMHRSNSGESHQSLDAHLKGL